MNKRERRAAKNEEISEGTLIYEIRVMGRLGETWSNWFEHMKITHQKGVTILTGKFVDQAALRGLLSKIWDLHLTLISACRLETNLTKKD